MNKTTESNESRAFFTIQATVFIYTGNSSFFSTFILPIKLSNTIQIPYFAKQTLHWILL